jgi:hypothetical protein
MWHQLEPVHAVFLYAPEVSAEAAAFGYEVETRWPSYFAWRLAPLGAVGPQLAASACYSFSPDMVAAHMPAAWAVAAPPQILAARERAVDQMYRALFGDLIGSPGLAEAAELACDAALAAGTAGRPLAAANADMPWPGEPQRRALSARRYRNSGDVVRAQHSHQHWRCWRGPDCRGRRARLTVYAGGAGDPITSVSSRCGRCRQGRSRRSDAV